MCTQVLTYKWNRENNWHTTATNDYSGAPEVSFQTVMEDETTDASNREQVTLIIRQVTGDLQEHEEFLGLYNVPSIDASALTSAPLAARLSECP